VRLKARQRDVVASKKGMMDTATQAAIKRRFLAGTQEDDEQPKDTTYTPDTGTGTGTSGGTTTPPATDYPDPPPNTDIKPTTQPPAAMTPAGSVPTTAGQLWPPQAQATGYQNPPPGNTDTKPTLTAPASTPPATLPPGEEYFPGYDPIRGDASTGELGGSELNTGKSQAIKDRFVKLTSGDATKTGADTGAGTGAALTGETGELGGGELGGTGQADMTGLIDKATKDLAGIAGEARGNGEMGAIYQSELTNIMDLIAQEEAKLRADATAMGKEADPQTLWALDQLRKSLAGSLEDIKEEMNRRGVFESGIYWAAGGKLRSEVLSEEGRMYAQRIGVVRDYLFSGLKGLSEKRIGAATDFGMAGADAESDYRQMLVQQRLAAQDAQAQRDWQAGQQTSQNEWEAGQSQTQRDWETEQAALDRQLKEKKAAEKAAAEAAAEEAAAKGWSEATAAAIAALSGFSSAEEAYQEAKADYQELVAAGVDFAALIEAINERFGTTPPPR
jgi:hypothetical protein